MRAHIAQEKATAYHDELEYHMANKMAAHGRMEVKNRSPQAHVENWVLSSKSGPEEPSPVALNVIVLRRQYPTSLPHSCTLAFSSTDVGRALCHYAQITLRNRCMPSVAYARMFRTVG